MGRYKGAFRPSRLHRHLGKQVVQVIHGLTVAYLHVVANLCNLTSLLFLLALDHRNVLGQTVEGFTAGCSGFLHIHFGVRLDEVHNGTMDVTKRDSLVLRIATHMALDVVSLTLQGGTLRERATSMRGRTTRKTAGFVGASLAMTGLAAGLTVTFGHLY